MNVFSNVLLVKIILASFLFLTSCTCGNLSCSDYRSMKGAYFIELQKSVQLGGSVVNKCSGGQQKECLKYFGYWCEDNNIKDNDKCANHWDNFFKYYEETERQK